jgi:PBSX family phage terminase large subunit
MASQPKFSEAQERSIALSTGQLNIWAGATRGGKTLASLFRWFAYLADKNGPRGEMAMVGRTRDTIGTNALLQMQNPELFGDAAATVKYKLGAPVAMIMDRRVHLYGANDSQAEAKIRGATFAGMYGDELTLLPRDFVLQAFNRLSVPGSKFFGTTNPGPSAHWLRKDFLLRADEPGLGLRHFHFTLDDNPSLTDEVKARIKATNTGMYYRRFVLGEWCNAEGAVYQMFDADRHVVDVLPVIKRWLGAGIDYGTTAAFAAVVLGVGVDRRLYAIAEWYWDSVRTGKPLAPVEYSRKFGDFLASVRHPGSQLYGITPEVIAVDPSEKAFIVQLHSDGFRVTGANNEVLTGIRMLSSLLASGKLLVHSSCKNLIDQLQSYAWDDAATEKGLDKPLKENDHAADALRYIINTTRSRWRNMLLPDNPPPNYEDTFGVAL